MIDLKKRKMMNQLLLKCWSKTTNIGVAIY